MMTISSSSSGFNHGEDELKDQQPISLVEFDLTAKLYATRCNA
jgi:hypothetical protein